MDLEQQEAILSNWKELFGELKKATPSSPAWYSIIDMCVGVMVAERIDQLEAALKTAQETE